jgi:hypothetical protein
MNSWPLLVLTSAVALPAALPAEEPATAAPSICQIPNNLILGPRTSDRPLPLLAGDAMHGFRPACTVAWTKLSPNSQPLAVRACYQDNLLQIENDGACGTGTGPLWVSFRWVKTSGEKQLKSRSVVCQRLDTGTYAATRNFPSGCVPPGKAAPPDATPRGLAPSSTASSAAPGPASPAAPSSASPATPSPTATAAAPPSAPAATSHPDR